LLFSVWDRISENEFADVVTQALAEIFPDDPPRFLAHTPHGHHDEAQTRHELKAAGFSDISVGPVDVTSKAPSPRDPAVAYCEGTPLRNEIEASDPSGLEHATAQATAALARKYGNGAIWADTGACDQCGGLIAEFRCFAESEKRFTLPSPRSFFPVHR
jgi:hypothetical protein